MQAPRSRWTDVSACRRGDGVVDTVACVLVWLIKQAGLQLRAVGVITPTSNKALHALSRPCRPRGVAPEDGVGQ